MKSLILIFSMVFMAANCFAQKAKANSDSTVHAYMTYTCAMHPQYVSNVEGKCPVCHSPMTLSPKERMKAEIVKLYTCPMHPEVFCLSPGKCPECNMDLIDFKPKHKGKRA